MDNAAQKPENTLLQRKNIRLKGWDYAAGGLYFITVCVKDKRSLLWDWAKFHASPTQPPYIPTIIHQPSDAAVGTACGRPPLSPIGIIIDNEIKKLNRTYEQVKVDKYVVMPNHLHMILALNRGSGGRPQAVPTVSRIINQFKGSVSKHIGQSIWQTRFYDHIIRDEDDYIRIWEYIDTNHLKRTEDRYYQPRRGESK